MDIQRATSILNVDLNALRQELGELYERAHKAAAQKRDTSGSGDGAMVVRGK